MNRYQGSVFHSRATPNWEIGPKKKTVSQEKVIGQSLWNSFLCGGYTLEPMVKFLLFLSVGKQTEICPVPGLQSEMAASAQSSETLELTTGQVRDFS